MAALGVQPQPPGAARGAPGRSRRGSSRRRCPDWSGTPGRGWSRRRRPARSRVARNWSRERHRLGRRTDRQQATRPASTARAGRGPVPATSAWQLRLDGGSQSAPAAGGERRRRMATSSRRPGLSAGARCNDRYRSVGQQWGRVDPGRDHGVDRSPTTSASGGVARPTPRVAGCREGLQSRRAASLPGNRRATEMALRAVREGPSARKWLMALAR